MPKHDNRLVGAAVGLGLVGAAAIGGILATRRKRRGNSDDAPGRTARRGLASFGKYEVVGRSVTIARPRQELFAFWRDFQNLPDFMENVLAVRPGADGRSIWTVRGPAGTDVDIETRIAREEPGRLIAWRSVEGSEIDTEGRVEFEDAPGERGTRVTAIIAYDPPAGTLGRTVAKLFMREPEVQARHDLRRFKMLMEAGEIATSARTADATRHARMEA